MGPIGGSSAGLPPRLPDTWTVEILDDGRIKIVTGPTSPAIHTTAEKMLGEINRLMGGEVKRTHRPDARTHSHHHGGHHHSH